MGTFKQLQTDLISPPKFLLRSVRKNTIEYAELLSSVQANGIIQNLLVRTVGDRIELVDGNWRLNCAIDAGLQEVPCVIEDLTDDEVLARQIQMNALRPETSRMEFAKHLTALRARDPTLTLDALAVMCCKSAEWIRHTLNLLNLTQEIQQSVDLGEIPLSNACELARLPPAQQIKLSKDARELQTKHFKAEVQSRLAEKIDKRIVNKETRLKKTLADGSFKPVAYLRSHASLRAEAKQLEVATRLLVEENAQSALDGWKLCLDWVMNLDSESIKLQQERWQYRHDVDTEYREALAKQHEDCLEEINGTPSSDGNL